MLKYIFFTALAIIILIRLVIISAEYFGHKVGLLSLQIYLNYLEGKLTDSELDEAIDYYRERDNG